jgi:excisionase family DNA binding protein
MDRESPVDLLEALNGVSAAVLQMEEEVLRALTTEQRHSVTEAQSGDTADEWFTLAESGDWLKIGRTTIYKLVREGHIPAYRIGRSTRVRRRDVEQWLEEGDRDLRA